MAENSAIEWTDHTFNPWVGCTKVSPACDHCYAESWAKRTGGAHLWQGERRRTSPANWRQPLKWNREAEGAQYAWNTAKASLFDGDEAAMIEKGWIKPTRPRVFCASLADVFDNQVPDEWRSDLWLLISSTPHLDWLLLTKRPQNILKMLPRMAAVPGLLWPWPNVWLGTTVENQDEADRRIPHLLGAPAAVRFLSCEPLLGSVDITGWLWGSAEPCPSCPRDVDCVCGMEPRSKLAGERAIGWVIGGGESGPGARPANPAWYRELRDQCASAGVAYFHKQNGEYVGLPEALDHGITPPQIARAKMAQLDGLDMIRVGKHAAGRLLDGIKHDAFPAAAS
ncbi:MAG: hypothetical protein JWL84_4189 [Rhodospirillales bacterium]|nr:hypothetical protein [Rhodospirillales bacterium]